MSDLRPWSAPVHQRIVGTMATPTTDRRSSSTAPSTEPAPFAVEAVDVSQIVVPLDCSPFAERALPVAEWAAAALGVHLRLVEVTLCDEEAEGAIRYLGSVARRHPEVYSWDVLQCDDVGQAITETVAHSSRRIACLATHGRDRAAALLGSVASSLLDGSDRPVLLVGPQARPVGPWQGGEAGAAGAVLVAVDGTARDDVLVPIALGWAARLSRWLVIATVAEPAPAPYRQPAATPRSHGPADPEDYVAALARRARGTGIAVDTEVVYDPVSVREGLVPLLDHQVALVVLGTRHRHGVGRTVLGSHAARIVHDAPIPALVVPFPLRP